MIPIQMIMDFSSSDSSEDDVNQNSILFSNIFLFQFRINMFLS